MARPRPDDAVTLDRIRAAQRLLSGTVERTPTLASQTLSAISGTDIVLNFENRWFIRPLKYRGACIKFLRLNKRQARTGMIAVSAGDRAQGAAHQTGWLGIPITIGMSRHAPFVQIDNTKKLGAQVSLAGDTVNGAAQEVRRLTDILLRIAKTVANII